MFDAWPEGWQEVRLGEVSLVNPESLGQRTDPDFAFGYIDISQIEHPGICKGWTSTTFATAPSRARRIVRFNDILVSTVRPYLRAFAKVPLSDKPLVASTGFAVVRGNDEVDQDFLFQHIMTDGFVEHLKPRMTGSNYPAISAADVSSYRFYIPSLDEQRRIAETLGSLDEAIDLNKRVADQAERTLRLARARLTGLDGSETGWVVQPVLDCFQLQRGHDLPVQNRRDGSVPVIASNGPVGFHDQAPIPAPAVITGRSGTIGKVTYFDRPCWPLNTTLFVRDFKGSDPRFVYHFLSAFPLAQHATGTGVPTLNRNDVHAVEVYWPELEQQQDRARILDSLEACWLWARAALEASQSLKQNVAADMLSGRVRVPASLTLAAPTRAVQPAFKRAVFAAEVVQQLHKDDRFGSVKHEKIVHLCELHLGLQDDLDRHAYKEAAGPYDPSARRSVERIFRQQKWFDPAKEDKRIVYRPLEASGGHARYFDRYFGDRKAEVQSIIDLLRPLTTQQCEIIVTLYAVWNDFLIDDHQPSDDEIIGGVLNNWTKSKRQIAEEKWRAALPWMRQKGLIPAGHGEKTRIAST